MLPKTLVVAGRVQIDQAPIQIKAMRKTKSGRRNQGANHK